MWSKKPDPGPTKCKLPSWWSRVMVPYGSEWMCPRCGDVWVKEWSRIHELPEMLPKDPRSEKGCGSWSCDCDPVHTEQIYDTGYFEDPDIEPVEYALLCMEHRRHLPCRRCK